MNESKREADPYFTDQLLSNGEIVEKMPRLSEDVREFNKYKNHMSKSTADRSDLDMPGDLETLLNETKGERPMSKELQEGAVHHAINNRKSKSVASNDFV